MIERETFYARMAICQTCEFWKGACLKGHPLSGAPGCPLKKFPGIDGADYLPDLPVPTPELPAVSANGCCGAKADENLQPLSWSAVLTHLGNSTAKWIAAGVPLVSREVYAERLRRCRACHQYQWFQCKHCKCVVYTKANLATESCPLDQWPQTRS